MPEYLTKIRTTYGDLQYDYNSLYGKPTPDTRLETAGAFADAQAVGNKIRVINTKLENIDNQISTHDHSTDDITSGTLSTDRLPVIPMTKGGTEATSGQDGLKNLLAAGPMILSAHQYGTLDERDKLSPVDGQIFFVKV